MFMPSLTALKFITLLTLLTKQAGAPITPACVFSKAVRAAVTNVQDYLRIRSIQADKVWECFSQQIESPFQGKEATENYTCPNGHGGEGAL